MIEVPGVDPTAPVGGKVGQQACDAEANRAAAEKAAADAKARDDYEEYYDQLAKEAFWLQKYLEALKQQPNPWERPERGPPFPPVRTPTTIPVPAVQPISPPDIQPNVPQPNLNL